MTIWVVRVFDMDYPDFLIGTYSNLALAVRAVIKEVIESDIVFFDTTRILNIFNDTPDVYIIKCDNNTNVEIRATKLNY